VETRRAALDTLESLGPSAAPAAAALVGALADRDKFVRWAAARTLGRIGPVKGVTAMPALTLLLTDPDLDVRLAATVALEHWGVAAQPAVPDLCRIVRATDPELRLAAIRALGAIGGPEGRLILAELTAATADPDTRVRQLAIQTLGQFGPLARDAVPALRWALRDEDAQVQKAAGQALLNILRPGQQ
jgi:HEAT repeat protein